MKTDILLYVEQGLTDTDLTFNETYTPHSLSEKLTALPGISGCYYSVPGSYSGTLSDEKDCIRRKAGDDVTFWKDLIGKTGSDHIIRIYCDSPFLDPAVIGDMLKAHLEYLAEFTYSENLPEGFTCEIISGELVKALPVLEEETLPLSQVVRTNINQFDIELFYREPDIRDRRLSFRSGKPRDKKVMQNLAGLAGGIPTYEKLKEIMDSNPQALYAGPSYLEIELTGRCELDCLFCYRNTLDAPHGDMEPQLFEKILKDMREFALPYTICLGGSGEPLMHKNACGLIESALKEELVERVIVETSGLYLDETYRSMAAGEKGGKLVTIVNINGHDADTYKTLHGGSHFERVLENVMSLKETIADGPSKIFVQVMKINETEPFLDSYYDFWEEKKVPIILQKQNTYLGRLEDRRYSDLTPLERTPCWHLQRDIYILNDGRVAFCKQDPDGKRAAGNITQEPISGIYAKKMEDYLGDYRGKYATSPDCSSCDEWYTFNF